MDIIIDTNILHPHPRMDSLDFRLVFDYLDKTGGKMIIPQIVLEELIANYRRESADAIREYERAHRKVQRLGVDLPPTATVLLSNANELADALLNFYDELSANMVAIAPYKPEYLTEVVRRAVNRVKPCSTKGEEFRDTLVWLTVVDYLNTTRDSQVAFISNNKREFAGDGGLGLHPDLLTEAEKSGTKLHYLQTLSEFVDRFTVTIAPIDLRWLRTRLPASRVLPWVKEYLEEYAAEEMEDYCSYALDNGDFQVRRLHGIIAWKDYQVEHNRLYEIADSIQVRTSIRVKAQAEVRLRWTPDLSGLPLTVPEQQQFTGKAWVPLRIQVIAKLEKDQLIDWDLLDWSIGSEPE